MRPHVVFNYFTIRPMPRFLGGAVSVLCLCSLALKLQSASALAEIRIGVRHGARLALSAAKQTSNHVMEADKKASLDRDFVRIAAPSLIQFAAEPVAALVDSAFIGRLGPGGVLGFHADPMRSSFLYLLPLSPFSFHPPPPPLPKISSH